MIGLAVAALVVVALAGAGLRLYMGRPAEDRLRPGEDMSLATFPGRVPQNGALACPPGYCAAAGAIASPVFAVGWERLARDWATLVAGEARVTPVVTEAGGRRLVLLQRSAGLNFPDVVTVEFVALGPDRSSLALYSRARYGRVDLGVNRKRVERWLARLGALARVGR